MDSNKKDLKLKVLNNFGWRFFERSGAQIVSFVVSLILARLLTPSVYGIVSLILVFSAILEVFIDSGLATALVQKRDADAIDFSSVFFFNLIMCIGVYLIMFLFAPKIAIFYKIPELKSLIRVLCLTLIISGVRNVQQAYVSKYLLFKKFFYATLVGTVSSGVISVFMAYNGFGVWAIVAQSLSNQAIGTVVLWFTVKWRPVRIFSWSRFKLLYSYAWKLLAYSIIERVYEKFTQLIIGKKYTTADLAYYNQGNYLPYTVISNLNASIDSVLFPTISMVQEDTAAVKAMLRRAMKVSTYFITPILLGLFSASEIFVKLLLTEKWLPMVFFLRVSCIAFIFRPINSANLTALKAIGRSDLILKLEILKKSLGLTLVLTTMWFGVKAMSLGQLLYSIFSVLIDIYPVKKIIKHGYAAQIMDILPVLALSVFMSGTVYTIQLLGLPAFTTLTLQIIVGSTIYLVGSLLFKIEVAKYIIDTVRESLLK